MPPARDDSVHYIHRILLDLSSLLQRRSYLSIVLLGKVPNLGRKKALASFPRVLGESSDSLHKSGKVTGTF